MAHIGTVGSKITAEVKVVNIYEYQDYKFSYYGTTHFIYTMADGDDNVLVWKTTSCMGIQMDDEGNIWHVVRKGDIIRITGKVKEHGEYKGTQQTVLTRCKWELIQMSLSKEEQCALKAKEQMESLKGKDFIWEMPYRQYKDHYADCETVAGSFTRYENNRGEEYRDPTIKVIIREGRLKPNGVRGKFIYGFVFQTDRGTEVTYRAVCEENARKHMKKEFPNSDDWKCIEIFHHSRGH